MSEEVKNFTDLNAWKEAHKFVLGLYELTKKFPEDEKYGLISQLRKAAVSITSNIAEGFSRYYFKDKVRFYYMSRGSASEVQNLLIIAKDLDYYDKKLFDALFEHSGRVQSLINGLINSISRQTAKKN